MVRLERFTAPVHSVDAVVHRMRALGAAWPERDGVAVFNRVYLAVTEEVDRRLETGHFTDARAAITLDVRFAERYLDAVEAVADERRPPACWRPLFQLRADLHIISTITSVTFYGTDRVGNDVAATGSITIDFANFGDTP